MTETKELDVGRIIDESSRNRVAVSVILLCGLIMFMDGYDYTIITVAAPLIMKEWGISKGAFGYAFSAAFFGYLFGAVIFGAIADRIGRKPTLLVASFIFSVGTLLVYFTHSLESLIAVRVFTGFGIGGAVPCAITLTSEYSPLKQRGKYVSLMYSGFLIGIVAGGYLAGAMLEHFGWRPLFLVGFFAPLAAIILLGFKLPESIRWIAVREVTAKRRALIARLLAVIQPGTRVDDATRFVTAAAKRKSSIRNLFAGKLSWVTPTIWIYYLVSAIAVFFISSWTPQLLTLKEYTVSDAAYITGTINVLVAAGCMLSGFYFDKAGFRNGAILYIIATVCIFFTGGFDAIAFVLLLMAGSLFINSAHMAVTILAPIVYPSDCRNMGGGAAIAAGRIGAIIGPIIGGRLLDTQLPLDKLIGVVAIPLVISAALCYIAGRYYDQSKAK
jgi:AAHS family 4-hydroxybenzoate transporter-like MFS transporter